MSSISNIYLRSSDLYEERYRLIDLLNIIKNDIYNTKIMLCHNNNMLSCIVLKNVCENILCDSLSNVKDAIVQIDMKIAKIEKIIVAIDFNSTSISCHNVGLKHINSFRLLTNLRCLDLSSNIIADTSYLKPLVNLRWLNVSSNNITDELQINNLKCINDVVKCITN